MRWLVLLYLVWPMTLSADVSGPARVIDGDTLEIEGTRLRLFGIDALESEQTCSDPAGTIWPCGAWVTAQVTALLAGTDLNCVTLELDRYGRDVARCRLNGADLSETIVAAGLATAYRQYSVDYVPAEQQAQAARLGIWIGDFQAPSEFRNPVTLPQAAPGDCVIKGNVSANGRIFHVPGQMNYAETRISLSDGERWFCTESEAQAAGWRAARR